MKKEIEKDFKRLNLDWVNPHLLMLLEGKLVPVETKNVSYQDGMEILKKKNLRAASVLELLRWSDWDGYSQVIAGGTIVKYKGEMYAPCLCRLNFSEPGNNYHERRLALINIKWEWRDVNIFLAVDESGMEGLGIVH